MNNNHMTLHEAVRNGSAEDINKLLQNNENIKEIINESKNGLTPLLLAVSQGHIDVVSLLLSFGADINKQSERSGVTPLHLAASYHNDQIATLLLQSGADINIIDRSHSSVLHSAAQAGSSFVLSSLLSRGDLKNINERCLGGRNALLYAAFGGHFEAVQILVNGGVQLDVTNHDGITALHVACQYGHTEMAQLLIESGANVNLQARLKFRQKDKQELNWTPLHLSISSYCTDLLLRKGADMNARTTRGRTPLHTLAEEGSKESVKKMIEMGAFIDVLDDNGETPLYCASSMNRFSVVKQLLLLGANVDIVAKSGYTPLAIACVKDNNDVVKEFIQNRGDSNSTLREDWSPLHVAAWHGSKKVVVTLLSLAQEMNVPIHEGSQRKESAADLAFFRGHSEVVDILLRHDVKRSPMSLEMLCQLLIMKNDLTSKFSGEEIVWWKRVSYCI